MKKIVVISLVILLIGFVLVAFYDYAQQSLSEPELETAVSPASGEKAEKDCGCQEKKNANHHQKTESVGELPELIVKAHAS